MKAISHVVNVSPWCNWLMRPLTGADKPGSDQWTGSLDRIIGSDRKNNDNKNNNKIKQKKPSNENVRFKVTSTLPLL